MSKNKGCPCGILLILLLCGIVAVFCFFNFQLLFPATWGRQVVDLQSLPSVPAGKNPTRRFADDFSKVNSDWQLFKPDPNYPGAIELEAGNLLVMAEGEPVMVYLRQILEKDVIVEFDVIRYEEMGAGGVRGKPLLPGYVGVGALCRVQPDGSYYRFRIGGAPYADADFDFLNAQGLLTPNIAGTVSWWHPDFPQHLRFECVGDRLSAYVNGRLVMSATDPALRSPGRVGLISYYIKSPSGGRVKTSIWLDNFVVSVP